MDLEDVRSFIIEKSRVDEGGKIVDSYDLNEKG